MLYFKGRPIAIGKEGEMYNVTDGVVKTFISRLKCGYTTTYNFLRDSVTFPFDISWYADWGRKYDVDRGYGWDADISVSLSWWVFSRLGSSRY